MNKQRTLDALIAELPDDFAKVKPTKKLSVKDAIIALRERVGRKVFNKRQLQDMIQAEYPQLAPVDKKNLDASLARTKEHWACEKLGEQNYYRFKQPK